MLLAQAQEEANRTLEIARQKADQLVAKDMVVVEAQRRAEQILSQARSDAEGVRADADEYVINSLRQLEAELGATALGEVYTFGPTFRAENSNTTRHLAEFWMIEPEMAFYDIHDNMNLAENFLKYVIKYILENCPDDVTFLAERLKKEDEGKKANIT